MKKSVRIILIVLVVLTIAFIFSRSIPSVEDSRSESESLLEFLKPLLRKFLPDELIRDHYIRKFAHLFEFAVLGTLVTVLFIYSNGLKRFVYAVLLFVMTAVTDETIQLFTQRGSELKDVWIDITGAVVGTLITFGVYALIRFIKTARKKRKEKAA